MATRTRVLALFLILLALAGAVASSHAQRPRAGIVTAVHGTATVTRASLTVPLALKFRDDVFARDRIATAEASQARILLGGAALLTVRERSVVTITETPRLSTIDLGTGGVALSVARERLRPGEALEIRTPNAVAGIRGTVILAEVAGALTRFTLLTGKVDVAAAGRTVTVPPLHAISIVGASVPGPVQPVTPADAGAASRRFELPLTRPTKGPGEWIAREHVEGATASLREHQRRGRHMEGPGIPTRWERRHEGDDRPGRDDSDRRRRPAFARPPAPVPALTQPPSWSKGRDKKDD